ncbi:MAG: (Fe-S)-binding protein [Candidatus Omnitrophota bacterium]|nr:MAG: (Fe-S)-binding protein [Candidatus Omnitrophota bacterium]RKY44955.1 MAG: (Fe-S)-binding protein [Candidatus Omnitrophota bacterium]HDN86234.1 4Fe-4S dicluster domain-containing protein [Candidatus Omnitrophota bacterium]
MFKKRVVLHFPKELVDKPIVYKLVKEFSLEFNILKAEVNPREEGVLVLEIKGEDTDLERGMEYLKKTGVKVQPLSQDVSMDKNKCVDCTVCIPLCPTQALVRNQNFEVEFIKERCIACGICISVCPYKAMSIRF